MSQQMPPANRMTLQTFKAKGVGAKKGHSLLKKKRDALKSRFSQMLKEIVDTKKAVGENMADCSFSIAKARWAGDSDFVQTVIQRVKKPSVTLKVSAENVAGVFLPKFDLQRDTTLDGPMMSLGAGQGGQVIQTCRLQHAKVLELLVRMASLQTSFITLDEEIKMTSRRVNALEYVVIPRMETIIHFIEQAMDEQEREEFFRVKKIVEKKKEKQAKEAADRAAEGGEAGVLAMAVGNEDQVGTAFDDVKKDAELVF
ncbi:vacuolar H-ATpase subunit D, putative [Perkinsus marinus ATCC 50983]|uniref:Vacuolar H-ATpase subunit D, putative n=1 Tax=Perkinsus marinus (strain ATCC 50983 / TXsc) TaxID=423536 RepID=C5KV51_PERM5|nr:vacuolar H-ATpase subunit D, putative [Perkinsus marinus ATCC 50983]XP_002779802.1 vacuolar H-ATpase subunit D, putative [Perkinsus marinus ATCC 50983]EER06781.1 vacuolar H-ATpase subunit D, putative [Perkinsus marinus ATCC 50983]EER11597.1 vacuolar H-ATpase subunit D, putative [Perkinsus marinus ATCC 50983]|eukprot:XP_002774965.1 vacuolar H-ATpase subunit D, putative [Perkinsus marinus ATCC 50983]